MHLCVKSVYVRREDFSSTVIAEATLYFKCMDTSAYRADRSAIRQAEASVFPSFFQSAEKLIIFFFEFSLPGT